MKRTKTDPPANHEDRQRLLNAYRMLVSSIREARSMQTVLWKEEQMRRLLRLMRGAA